MEKKGKGHPLRATGEFKRHMRKTSKSRFNAGVITPAFQLNKKYKY